MITKHLSRNGFLFKDTSNGAVIQVVKKLHQNFRGCGLAQMVGTLSTLSRRLLAVLVVASAMNLMAQNSEAPRHLLTESRIEAGDLPRIWTMTCEFYKYETGYLACQTKLKENLELMAMAATTENKIKCVTTPIVLLSDGTNNAMFMLHSNSNAWKGQSVGAGTVFHKGKVLSLFLADEGVCVDPPHHLHLSFVMRRQTGAGD